MQSLSLIKTKKDLSEAFVEMATFQPSVVFVFAAPSILADKQLAKIILDGLKDTPFIGCSTAGEICDSSVGADSVSFLALKLDNTPLKFVAEQVARAHNSVDAGEAIAKKLKAPDLKAVFVLAPGISLNGSALLDGMEKIFAGEVVITGGMAADEIRFHQTNTMLNGNIYADYVVAVGFYGSAIHITSGSHGGWKPYGPARRVTRSEGNILYELDGRPALQLYKEYLGEKAKELPASGLHYPFAILKEDRSTTGVIRSALDIDHEKGALILAGDMPNGSLVCLMHAEADALTDGATQAAQLALKGNKTEKGAALLVSCVGRRVLMGLDAEDETEAVQKIFGADVNMAGYYSYGEICPFIDTGKSELHNQTMTITYITEK